MLYTLYSKRVKCVIYSKRVKWVIYSKRVKCVIYSKRVKWVIYSKRVKWVKRECLRSVGVCTGWLYSYYVLGRLRLVLDRLF